jgi:general secretion pathway protein G
LLPALIPLTLCGKPTMEIQASNAMDGGRRVPSFKKATSRRAAAVPSRGFSLLELMLVIALGAVLLSVAVPTYRSYVLRARYAAAIGDIGRLQLAVIRYQTANNDTLPASLAAIGMDTLLDPWGQPYRYLGFAGLKGKGAMRKDKNLNPLNTDFDLYSIGPDGKTIAPLVGAGADDVIRANDGQFVGKASDY